MTREEMDLIRGFVGNIQSLKDAHINDNLPINYGMLCTIVIKGWELLKELKALEQEPCEDAISRQAAQEGLTHLMDSDGFRDSVGYVQKSLVRKMLVNLPPVQPKLTECEDAISREDALKALAYDIESFEFKSGVSKHMNEIANLLNTIYEIQSVNIKALPSVRPKIKVGHWINKKPRWIPSLSMTIHDAYECSNCGESGVHYWDYCPYCGARMVEPQESEDKE